VYINLLLLEKFNVVFNAKLASKQGVI